VEHLTTDKDTKTAFGKSRDHNEQRFIVRITGPSYNILVVYTVAGPTMEHLKLKPLPKLGNYRGGSSPSCCRCRSLAVLSWSAAAVIAGLPVAKCRG
jgi:hypothetical protein